jgi:hypothetical protein
MSLPLIDSALMSILLEAGLRKSEASNMQVRRIRLDEPPSIVVVAGKGGKDRLVPMNARLQQAVNDLLFMDHLEPEAYLWYTRPGGGRMRRSTPIGKGSFATWWGRCLAEAGVRYQNPHIARHTFATRWLRRSGRLETLSLVMGHANIATTHTLYAHLDTSDILIDVARIDSLTEPLALRAGLDTRHMAAPDKPAVERLEDLGVRGILLQLARDGQILDVRCEMPQCYCFRGRRHFDPRSPISDWSPTPDHYPRLKSHGGHLTPDNVRLAHLRCNQRDYGWRVRINAMLGKRMSLEEIAASLNAQKVPPIHGTNRWTPAAVRKAFVS